jgi:dCMP deaminase
MKNMQNLFELKQLRAEVLKLKKGSGIDHDFEINQLSSDIKTYIEDTIFIENACNLSCMSHCVSKQVGCIIVVDGVTVSTGINGTSPNMTNCDSLFKFDDFDQAEHRQWADKNEIHAEMNAIFFAAKRGISLNGGTLYCSLQPCNECSKNLPAVGIKRIVFKNQYDRVTDVSAQAQRFLDQGIKIDHLQPYDDAIVRFKFRTENLIQKIGS